MVASIRHASVVHVAERAPNATERVDDVKAEQEDWYHGE